MGEGEPKSATKPLKVDLLSGIKVFECASTPHFFFSSEKGNLTSP